MKFRGDFDWELSNTHQWPVTFHLLAVYHLAMRVLSQTGNEKVNQDIHNLLPYPFVHPHYLVAGNRGKPGTGSYVRIGDDKLLGLPIKQPLMATFILPVDVTTQRCRRAAILLRKTVSLLEVLHPLFLCYLYLLREQGVF